MSYTLLDLTQTILSSMDSDEVASISDTVEATQVANVIKTAYFDIINRANLPEHYSLVNLTQSAGGNQPTLMTVPTDVEQILWVKYDNATAADTDVQMLPVMYKPLPEFLEAMHLLDQSADNVDSFPLTTDDGTITILYITDKVPQVYTSFDDRNLIFDSIDLSVDTVKLQTLKSLAYAKMIIPFTLSDSFVPDLDEPQFALLLNEAKALAWAELKQTQHAKAEVSSRRGWTSLQKTKFATEKQSYFDQLPNYGRR